MGIESRIIDIIADQLGVKRVEVRPDALIADDLGADSLDTVELNMVLEETFGIKIPDDDIRKIKKVKDVIQYIESKVSASQK